MSKPTDIRVLGTRLHFIPVRTRVPLKFGAEVTTSVTVARACVRVADRRGRVAEGWGETPLSVQWVWPGGLPYETRHTALREFCVRLAEAWTDFDGRGHALEVGADFQGEVLPALLRKFNRRPRHAISNPPASTGLRQPRSTSLVGTEPVPWLAALDSWPKDGIPDNPRGSYDEACRRVDALVARLQQKALVVLGLHLPDPSLMPLGVLKIHC